MINHKVIDHTVTTFVSSGSHKQLSSRRVLFYIKDRFKKYDCSSNDVVQHVMPPVSVALCPTSFCVRKCVFCSNATRNLENRKICAEYDEHVFENIITDLNSLNVRGVSIAGGGEPLLYNKPALRMLLTADHPSYRIGIHTNGVLLDTLLVDEIIESRNIQYINVSVVAHNEALYKIITEGDKNQFCVVERNIKQALQIASEVPDFPTFGVKILINRENYRYVAEIKEYFESLGVRNVLLRCVGNFEPGQDVELTDQQYEELIQTLNEGLHLPKEQIQAITGKAEYLPSVPSRCWIMALQYTAGIDPDGEVYLCSPWSQKEFSIGNVNERRFQNIWGSARHKSVAQKLSEKMQRGECNPLLCRHYYSNLSIDGYINGKIQPLIQDDIEDMYGRFI